MICSKCGLEMPNYAKICPTCGWNKNLVYSGSDGDSAESPDNIDETAQDNTPYVPPKKGKKKLAASAVAAVLIFALVVCFAIVPTLISIMPTVSKPDTVSDYDSLKFSNLNNSGLAIQDEDGIVYYTDSTGCIHKLLTDGTDSVICESQATCLNIAGDRIYYIGIDGSYNSVCSILKDGSDTQTVVSKRTISYIYVEDDSLYFVENNGTSLPNRGAVYMYNMNSGSSQNVAVEVDSYILSVYVVDDIIYYYGYSQSDYTSFFKYVSKDNLQHSVSIEDKQSGNAISPYSLTVCGDTAYYISTDDFCLYSISLDSLTPQQLGGTDCESLMVYGGYIYYTTYGNNALCRISLSSLTTETVKSGGVMFPCCAGDKIYYIDSDTLGVMCINLDGSGNKVVGN